MVITSIQDMEVTRGHLRIIDRTFVRWKLSNISLKMSGNEQSSGKQVTYVVLNQSERSEIMLLKQFIPPIKIPSK